MQLVRPANVVTSIADGLAGISLGCLFLNLALPGGFTLAYIVMANVFLYAGGIVFNDVFDAKVDKIERPQRPIPSGKVNGKLAAIFGSICFALGVLFAFGVNQTVGWLAILIVLMCFLYNGKAKHHVFAGPIVMGSCRALNLLLGITFVPAALDYWYIAFVPLVYIAAITNISRGEVYGDNKTAMRVSLLLYTLVIIALLYVYIQGEHYIAIIFIGAFAFMILKPLLHALKTVQPADIQKSVKYGVLALILLNASWAAISGFYILSLIVVSLLPISIYLSKKFAVT